MDTKTLKKTLIDFGLTENEANVYYAALALGPTTILQIAKTANIKRTTVYAVVENLVSQGLMSVQVRGFKKLFVAEDPEKLKAIIQRREEQLTKALPEFAALYNLKGGESLVKYYEGVEGAKSTYDTLLKRVRPHEDYLVIAAMEQWYDLDPVFFQKFIERRAKLPINLRLLLMDSPMGRQAQRKERVWNGKIKLLPKETKLTTNIVVIPSMVVIHQLIPPVTAIVIENSSLIKTLKEMFEIMWRALPG